MQMLWWQDMWPFRTRPGAQCTCQQCCEPHSQPQFDIVCTHVPHGYIDFSWLKADPLSNVVWTDKWGSLAQTIGGLEGGTGAALLANTWYSAPLVSPAGAEGFSGAESTGGFSAGDDGYALAVEIGKEWGMYVAGLEGGRDAGDASQLAVEQAIENGVIDGNYLEVSALATATAITAIGTTGLEPLGQG